MANPINLGLRGLQFLWTIIILALVGNMIHDASAGNPSVVNYAMFVAVFSALSLIYLIGASINEAFALSPIIPLAVDALNVLFFLAGGIALAAKLGAHSCSNDDYVLHNSVTNGSSNPTKRCREAQAVTVFLWFGFISYLGSLIFSGLAARGGGANLRGGIRKGPPAMSQA
ncbi:hypothetical protein MMC29_008262 [Sticta canariensis]|nr:hypothetical protein [Sticta canariensis]